MTRLAEAILATVSSGFSVVDLCTGSGCVPLLLRQLLRSRINRVVGVDISPQAIELAEENATSLQLNADFAQLDLFDPSAAKRVIELAEGKVGLLISNPPYIPLDEYKALPQSVRAYEDPRALLGDPDGGDGDGLAFYRRIAELLPAILDQNLPALKGLPRLAVEIGEKQGQAVRDVFIRQNAGVIVRTEVWPDQYGRDRAVVGWTR
jgi:HemK-like putative methylase